MLKYCEYTITFAEVPDEISLALSISSCPCNCECCSEPHLRNDIGTELTEEEINRLIENNPGITVFLLLGGDHDHLDVVRISNIVHAHGLKIGMYSGRDFLDMDLLNSLDYYKIGRWIFPKGPVETWSKQNCGPLTFPFSNQVYFEKHGNSWVNATHKFRKYPINNLEKEIIK